jgi:hypothetical protein
MAVASESGSSIAVFGSGKIAVSYWTMSFPFQSRSEPGCRPGLAQVLHKEATRLRVIPKMLKNSFHKI